MKNFKKLVALCFFLICALNVLSQSEQDFNDVLKGKIVSKVISKKIGKDISHQTYLGAIRDDSGNIKYYVVKEFAQIQAAIVMHGNSRILFFDKSKKLAAQVILSTPDELPLRLKNNFLYFKYTENSVSKTYKNKIFPLPGMICVAPKESYSVEYL